MTKKIFKQKMIFSILTKNLNKLLLKDGMGLRMKTLIWGLTEKFNF